MSVDMQSIPKRVASIKDEVPKQRKRSRTGGSKDLYDGHSQDVMLAKTLIDPDHQCSVTTVKAYVTHVCAWFRFCRTLHDPNYTLVSEEKLSGFLTWATQTPRLPCKTGAAGGTGGAGTGGSMSYQSARRYVEGGILALWRRYRKADEENPLHALSYLNTKYAIREATAGERPRSQPEHSYAALAISQEEEDALVRTLLGECNDISSGASIRAWAYYCLGAATWIPGARRLHLRLESLTMALRTDARLVEHTTIPFLEFRVSPDPAAPTARFAEVSVARHVSPLSCAWFAIALLVFQQWQAQPSAMAAASLYDIGTWLRQPLFLADADDSRAFVPDETRVRMVLDEISPVLARAAARLKTTGDSHIIRRRDKMMAEALGLSAPQVVRLERWRVHHRRAGVTRQQTFFDLALVLSGQNPPPPHADAPHAFRSPPRTRLQVPDHLLAQVFPWLDDGAGASATSATSTPSGGAFVARQRSHSMSAAHSEDVARAERSASLRLMRELATVLLQDSAALMADPLYAPLLDAHPLFQAPLFASRAFRDFCAYAAQALSLQHTAGYAQSAFVPQPPPPPPSRRRTGSHPQPHPPPLLQHALSMPPVPMQMQMPPTSLSSDALFTLGSTSGTGGGGRRFPLLGGRSRRHTFETIGEEDSAALAQAAAAAQPNAFHPPPAAFNPMLLSQPLPLPFPTQLALASPPPQQQQQQQQQQQPCQSSVPMAFPQLAEEPADIGPSAPISQQHLMQIIDYLSVYNSQQQQQQQHHLPHSIADQHLAPCLPTDSACVGVQPLFHAGMPASASASAAAAASQFPRLASESSESTASPELPSSRNCSQSFSFSGSSPFAASASDMAAAVAAAAASAGMSSLAPSEALLSNVTAAAHGALPAPIALHHGHHGHSHLLDVGGDLSAYFSSAAAVAAAAAAAAAAAGVARQDYIDPSAIVTPCAPLRARPKSFANHRISPSSLASSPTPTPSASSPGLYPSSAATAVDPSALHFSIDPHKLQFKTDKELFM
ncbi:hypothetical protein LPJ72_002212 [Coemansia sp. Benny D160-2]|nr:hypothetical protein LPJ72_002212 [Coemansia sp. Benny D160-2]